MRLTSVLIRPIHLPLILGAILSAGTSVHAADGVISLDGNFGSFISLGAAGDEMLALGPDRVEPAAVEEERIPSFWHYFTSRSIRVRTCADDGRVAAINARASSVTQKYLTEAGVRIGDGHDKTAEAYGDRLQLMPETDGAIWFVDHESNNNRLTFGFSTAGEKRWVALGALRDKGWTCGTE